jgi:urease accessory protein
MYDAACLSDPPVFPPVFQRARGALSVSFKRRGAATVLDGLRQEGCLKARFPRIEPTEWATAVTLNTSGGVAGGDRLSLAFGVGQGAQACIAAQAAERIYRSVPGGAPSSVQTQLTVAEGGAVEWLPQETILFDRSALNRRLEVKLAPDALFLGVESLVFGRKAMGERVEHAHLRDLIRIRRGETLLLHDAIRLDGAVDALLQRPAIAGGAAAMATLVYVAPDAEHKLAVLRAAFAGADNPASLPPPKAACPSTTASRSHSSPESSSSSPIATAVSPTEPRELDYPPSSVLVDVRASSKEYDTEDCTQAAASVWNGLLLARILAADGAALRRRVTVALAALRATRPLPRVWMC